jgi:hypothetical protein
MLIPQEFKDLCACFHQDTFRLYPTFDDAIADAVGGLRKDQRDVVRRFLTKILDQRHDDGELKRAWRRTSAQIHFPGTKGVRAVFELMQAAVEEAERREKEARRSHFASLRR